MIFGYVLPYHQNTLIRYNKYIITPLDLRAKGILTSVARISGMMIKTSPISERAYIKFNKVGDYAIHYT